MKILNVCSYMPMCRINHNLLTQLGKTDVIDTNNAHVAAVLEKLRAANYDLVIADWETEPSSGLQILKEIRADTELRNLRFIMAGNSPAHANAAKEAGANDYIVRPFNTDRLKKSLQLVFGD